MAAIPDALPEAIPALADVLPTDAPVITDVNSPAPQPAPQDTVPQTPTGLSWRDSPKLMAFAAAMTFITALYFYNLRFPLDAPSTALVATIWLGVGWASQWIWARRKSARNGRH
jgi:hypothetical protein